MCEWKTTKKKTREKTGEREKERENAVDRENEWTRNNARIIDRQKVNAPDNESGREIENIKDS